MGCFSKLQNGHRAHEDEKKGEGEGSDGEKTLVSTDDISSVITIHGTEGGEEEELERQPISLSAQTKEKIEKYNSHAPAGFHMAVVSDVSPKPLENFFSMILQKGSHSPYLSWHSAWYDRWVTFISAKGAP